MIDTDPAVCEILGCPTGQEMAREIDRLRNELTDYRETNDSLREIIQSHKGVCDAYDAEIRRAKQSLDCTYGDTPGLIHCSDEHPCAVHREERLRAENEALRHDIARHVAICAEQATDIERLREALRRAGEEPNLDRARAIADSALESRQSVGIFGGINGGQSNG